VTGPALEKLSACPLCVARSIRSIDSECRLCCCEACGLVFDNPRPTAATLAEYYSGRDKYEQWLSDSEKRDKLWRQRLSKILTDRKGGSLLDIGAGIGQFLHHAQSHFTRLRGTEVSQSACNIARERYAITLDEGNIETINFGAERFDVITLFHVIEHVPYPGAFLSRIYDLCAPGGAIIVAVPNELESARGRLKAFVKHGLKWCGLKRFQVYGKYGFSRIAFGALHDEIHVSHFNRRTIVLALEQAGFGVRSVSLDPFFVAGWPASWFEQAYYLISSALFSITGRNRYDTLWIEAEKKEEAGRPICPACGNRFSSEEKTYSSPGYRLFRCWRCECVFADPMKSAGKEWYEVSAMYRFDTGSIRSDLRWYEKAFCEDRPGNGRGRLLNVGCGMNGFLRKVREIGYCVTAVDFNEQAVSFTKEKLGIAEVYAADILSFTRSYRGDPFEVITVFEVFEHMEDPAALCTALKRILAPGGILCLSVPNRERLLPSRDAWDYPPHHLTRWSRRSIAGFLTRNGFSVTLLKVSSVSPEEMVDKTGFLFWVPRLEQWQDGATGIFGRIASGTLLVALKFRTLFHAALALAAIGCGQQGKNMYIRAMNVSQEAPENRATGASIRSTAL
jgi:2-polyprenyl-3-methyl-5-hydroxy-6-metoxy-1,4-benzoquinol methylase